MEAIFGPESYLFDPVADYDSNSFLSFSSLSSLSPPSWADLPVEPKEPAPRSVSDTSSPSPLNPFEIISSAFESTFSSGQNVGIFHTPTKSPSSESRPQLSQPRSSSSSDSWGTPITPSTRSSSDTFAFNAGNDLYLTPSQLEGFSWDESANNLAGPSYTPVTPVQQAHRVASNPVLGSSRQPRTLKQITSMPALKEEEQMATTASQWFDPSAFLDNQSLQMPAPPVEQGDKAGETLADDFDWVFGDYGLGETVSADTTLFAAFQNDLAPDVDLSSKPLGLAPAFEPTSSIAGPSNTTTDMSWLPGPSTQVVNGPAPTFDFTQQTSQPSIFSFTIDPTAIMTTNGFDEDVSRPSSAPGLNVRDGSSGMLSVPMADIMTRSLSSEGYVPSRNAPHRDLFSYAPQQIPSGPPGPQPLYTCDPSPSYNTFGSGPSFPRAMPLTPTPKGRSASHGLTIQINPPPVSTYVPSLLPPTPQSATFAQANGQLQPQQSQPMPMPMPMQRAGTNPLPAGVKGMGITMTPSSLPKTTGLPPHLARAQAIVQMQQAKEEAERQVIRQETASRRVGMNEASVMQPQGQRRQQTIMGWEGPSAQTGSMPVLTSTPLIVHPPPVQYNVVGAPMVPHRVHPPPHPGTINTAPTSRPIARLPSSPVKGRKASVPVSTTPSTLSPTTHTRAKTTPSKSRSPSGRRKAAPAPGGFSWGETTFINFTSDDAEKLLTGVAPSGSQSKRKREEDAARDGMMPVITMDDRERSKRSRSDE